MLKVGITGGIGSGKTTIAAIFELLGVPVYYADAASKNLYDTDEDLKQQVILHFGEEVYTGGNLNRQALAAKVFGHPEKLHLLNSLVHPPTIRHARSWMQQQQAPYVLKEAALIFESGSSADLDYVIGVYAPEELRIQRAMQRDGLSNAEVMQRMARQISESIKMRLCDFVVVNDEKQMVIPQVLDLHQKLLDLSATAPTLQ